jgi:hypothetical protein
MERLQDPKFVHGNLKKGAYFWRVSVQKDSQESFFSETRKFVIFQDRIPPELSVEFPPEIVHQDFFTLKGKTEPGCLVYVMGKQIQAAKSGEFEYPLKLQFGINIIVVESVDVAGNITYRSRLITGKF